MATDWTQDANMVFAIEHGSDFGAGDMVDSTANENDFTPNADGDPDWSNSDPFNFDHTGDGGGYAVYDGNSSVATASSGGSKYGTADFSTGCWVRRDVEVDFATLIYQDDDIRLTFTADGEIHCSYIDSDTNQQNIETGSGTNDCPNGEEHHIVFVSDEDGVFASDNKIYIDGVQNDGSAGAIFTMTGKTDNTFFLGARGNVSYYDGDMDEPFLYVGQLTSTNVNEIYDFGISGGGTGVTVTPAVLTVTASVQAPSILFDNVISISVLTLTSVINASTIQTGNTISVGALSITVSVQTVTINTGLSLSLVVLNLVSGIQSPSVSTSGSITVSLGILNLTSSVQSVSISTGNSISLGVLTLNSSVQSPSVIIEESNILDVLTLNVSVQIPSVGGNITISLGILNLTVSIPSSTIRIAVLPNVLNLTSSVQSVTITKSFTVALSVLSITASQISLAVSGLTGLVLRIFQIFFDENVDNNITFGENLNIEINSNEILEQKSNFYENVLIKTNSKENLKIKSKIRNS